MKLWQRSARTTCTSHPTPGSATRAVPPVNTLLSPSTAWVVSVDSATTIAVSVPPIPPALSASTTPTLTQMIGAGTRVPKATMQRMAQTAWVACAWFALQLATSAITRMTAQNARGILFGHLLPPVRASVQTIIGSLEWMQSEVHARCVPRIAVFASVTSSAPSATAHCSSRGLGSVWSTARMETLSWEQEKADELARSVHRKSAGVSMHRLRQSARIPCI